MDPDVTAMAMSVDLAPMLVCTRCVDIEEVEPGRVRTIVEMVKATFKA
jgi:hypothetical protein